MSTTSSVVVISELGQHEPAAAALPAPRRRPTGAALHAEQITLAVLSGVVSSLVKPGRAAQTQGKKKRDREREGHEGKAAAAKTAKSGRRGSQQSKLALNPPTWSAGSYPDRALGCPGFVHLSDPITVEESAEGAPAWTLADVFSWTGRLVTYLWQPRHCEADPEALWSENGFLLHGLAGSA